MDKAVLTCLDDGPIELEDHGGYRECERPEE